MLRFIMYIIQSLDEGERGRRGEVTTFMKGQEGAVECHASFM